jgi:hypothetical protein
VSVASLFFSLPASEGFLLAGGAALAAQNLTSRPTHDLDLFTRAGATSVPETRDAFEAKELLLRRAVEVDVGFDPAVLATVPGSLGRFRDDEIPIDPERSGPAALVLRAVAARTAGGERVIGGPDGPMTV